MESEESTSSEPATGDSTASEPTTSEPTTSEQTTSEPTTGGATTGDSDTTPPTLINVSPEDGATGALADVLVVFEFSERMDVTSTEHAYQSTDLPTSQVSFAWNGAGTVLTVVPNAPLTYASGDGSVANTYSFSLMATATDLALKQAITGNRRLAQGRHHARAQDRVRALGLVA